MICAVPKKIQYSVYLLPVVAALGTIFFRIGALPFVGADECRYARIAEEMNGAGRWVTPLLQGLPWLEKPPLYYWLTIPMIRAFGMSETAARLAPALCALLAAVAVIWLGTRLWTRQAGLWSGLILLTGIGYCAFGRSASMDMPFTACLTSAFAVLALAVINGRPVWWQTGGAYVLLGLAVLAKGPAALVLGAGILVLFWVFDEQGGSLDSSRVIWGGLIAFAVAFPWFWLAFRENGFSFVSIFFINHNIARYVTDVHHHEQPFYYFVPVLLGLLFPWSGWLPALIPGSLRARALNWRAWDRATLFLACWALFPLLFFSFSTSKLPGYVLPCLPPIALLLGRRLAGLSEAGEAGNSLRFSRWFYLVLSAGLAVALPIVFQIDYGGAWKAGLLLAITVAVPALLAFSFAGRGRYRAAVLATAAQGVVFVMAAVQFGSAPVAEYHSTRAIAGQVLEADAGGEPIVTYCYFHHTLHYYTGYRVGDNITDPGSLLDQARRNRSLLVVTELPQVQNVKGLPGLSVTLLGQQGNLRLLRVVSQGR